VAAPQYKAGGRPCARRASPVQLCDAAEAVVGSAPRDARPWPVHARGTRVEGRGQPVRDDWCSAREL
jgi:hypothetical protein